MSKEVFNLFLYEKNRRNCVSESLYYSNFVQTVDGANVTCFRVLYAPEERVMAIHLLDLPNEQSRKDYLDTFREFMDSILSESSQKLTDDNKAQDEPFTIYLERNKNLMKNVRNCSKPLVCENNLQFKVYIYY